MQNGQFSDFQTFKKILYIVYGAIFSGLLFFLVISYYVSPQVNRDTTLIPLQYINQLMIADLVLVLLLVPGINWLYRSLINKNLNSDNLTEKLSGYLRIKIVIWALIEMFGIIILVQFFLSNQLNILILFLASIYLLIRHAPRDREISELLNLPLSEIEQQLTNKNYE